MLVREIYGKEVTLSRDLNEEREQIMQVWRGEHGRKKEQK